MRRGWPLILLSVLALLPAGGGCSPTLTNAPGPTLEFEDVALTFEYRVRNVKELWADDGEPLCRIRFGSCHVERWRDGAVWLDFGRGTRVPLAPAEAWYDGRFAAERPRGFLAPDIKAGLTLPGFIAAPFKSLPRWLADPALPEGDLARERVRDLRNHVLTAAPASVGHGRLGRSGEVTVRLTLTALGRRQLQAAADAERPRAAYPHWGPESGQGPQSGQV